MFLLVSPSNAGPSPPDIAKPLLLLAPVFHPGKHPLTPVIVQQARAFNIAAPVGPACREFEPGPGSGHPVLGSLPERLSGPSARASPIASNAPSTVSLAVAPLGPVRVAARPAISIWFIQALQSSRRALRRDVGSTLHRSARYPGKPAQREVASRRGSQVRAGVFTTCKATRPRHACAGN